MLSADVAYLKDMLRREVELFCRDDRRLWKQPIIRTIRELREIESRAVFFGGVLRSLLVSRLFNRRLGRPRDIDIVVQGAAADELQERFQQLASVKTRFGGLRLRRMEWQFDVWPLHLTWAFVHDKVRTPHFADLPSTTFFNLEAIAVEVWPRPGQTRTVYSGNNQFFDGIIRRFLELNREENPFPGLGVVRALLLAASIDFRLGPRLSRHLTDVGARMTSDELEHIQLEHYGRIQQTGHTLLNWIRYVADAVSRGEELVSLPIPRQLKFWSDEFEVPHIHLRIIPREQSTKSPAGSALYSSHREKID